MGYADFDLTM